ncbi:hypothetical protein Tco_1057524 [Tanacetum coccineum]|uniref:Uncharacterized protein n=1 Tax=Tanacetum coccineum TaxID=301880 RepID=A0ABQ5H7E6_9ASTR
MDEDLRESYCTIEKRLFHEGRFITPYFIEANNMLPSFQAVGLEPFLTLDEPIYPRFVDEFYHSLEVKRDEEERPYIEFNLGQFTFELDTSQISRIFQISKVLETFYTSKWSLNSLDDHLNSHLFGPKHDLVLKNITIPRTTQTQLQSDPNKLYIDDLRREEFKKNNKSSHAIVAMLVDSSLTITSPDKPTAIVPLIGSPFFITVMNPLDISRNPIKENGKRIASPSASSTLSSSSDGNEAPLFFEIYEELSDNE